MAAGVYITNRVNKIPLVLTFFGTYFLLFTTTASRGAWGSGIHGARAG